ncbi:hypothetical protein DRE_02980 [Drechslerella stenobrocha 248]|uniref:Uncharacterized protein n=1 Tax=Drechslerella stenobrocha 248 TaxID=1043628 RepID=W7IFA4_9PEZI|nr:hypothetical protein DRE_02980 [Drechslerella stenobrocha 248]
MLVLDTTEPETGYLNSKVERRLIDHSVVSAPLRATAPPSATATSFHDIEEPQIPRRVPERDSKLPYLQFYTPARASTWSLQFHSARRNTQF